MNVFEHSFGSSHYRVTIVPKSHVIVERFDNGGLVGMQRFVPGDQAEYDSYNLSYYGPILSIGAKTITVQTTGGGKKMLKPDTFAWRNWNFSPSEAAVKNSETMQYI
ncbi:MAG: hypothetical protein EBR82_00015 [Caulobacteraceae bacterium]|nr:hypothetical protein [Caulobacteraceae bacterium]